MSSITVVSDDNYPPYIFRDQSGELQGILVDQWKLWGDKMGLTVHFVAMAWRDAQQCIQEGKADVIDTIFLNEERAKIYDFTKPYTQLDVPVFIHNSLGGISDLKTLHGFTIGVKMGDSCIEVFRRNGIETLKEYDSYESIIQAAAKGDIRVFSIDKPPAHYYLYKMNLENEFQQAFILYSGQFHRAVLKGKSDLLALINEGFSRISQEEYRQIEQKWMGTPLIQTKHLYWILYVVLLVLLLVLLLILLNILLRRKIRKKTSELETTLQELTQSEEKYRELVENSRSIIIKFDMSGCLTFINEYAQTFFGYRKEEIIGKNIVGTIVPETELSGRELHPLIKSICEDTENYRDNENENITKSGKRVWIHWSNKVIVDPSGHRVGILSIGNDISERRQVEQERLEMERRMLHVQKLESLGVLAGGMAHDFNNILMAILGHADLALLKLPAMSPARDNLTEIENGARRAAELCRQMLAYSGRGRFVIESIRLNELVSEMVHLLKTAISKKAILNLNLDKNLPLMDGDATQIRQILMNLITNASEAIGERSGVITLSTGSMHCSSEYLKEMFIDQVLRDGRYVYLEVSDTGEGMDKQTLSRIYEPFFTTKFTGRGLGMAAVLGIVRGHNGAIKIYSEVGIGTTFKILFPIGREALTQDASRDEIVDMEWQGGGCVLLVDDEESIRALAKDMLELIGFTVVIAGDGREALQVFGKQKESIDLVLLDLTMPIMDGQETFRELRRIDSEVPVILSSGYTEQEISARFAGKKVAGFIQKPYSLSALRECCHQVMQSIPPRVG